MRFKILKNFAKFLSGNTLASLLSLINLSLISQYIGLEGFGFFVLSQTAYLLTEQIINIRGWQYFISRSKYEIEDIKILYGTNNTINLAAFLVSNFLVYVTYISTNFDVGLYIGVLVYLTLILFRNYDSAYVILRRKNMYGTLSIFNISLSAVRLVCIYVLNCFYNINFMDVVYVFVVSEIIYFIILNLYSSYLSGGYIVLFRFDFNMIKNGFEINLTTIFDLPVSTLDTYVVNYFFGTESVGVYKLIRKYVSVLGRVISPLNQVLFPEIINIAQDQKRKFLLKCILATFFLSLVLGFSISYSIFKLDLDFFSNIREANLDKIEIYFLSIMGVEVIALTFSILNYLLVSYGKNIVNGKAVFLANLVFFMTLLILSYLTKDIIIATSVSLFLQVLFLIIYRIKVIFKCGI